MVKKFNLYLISDSTGETLENIAKAVIARFNDIEPIEYAWNLIQSQDQLNEIIIFLEKNPGIIMYTIADSVMREVLKSACNRLNIPCISVLSNIISSLASYLGTKAITYPSNKHELDDEYFSRIDAINYAISHDDGQSSWNIDQSDIVIIGASRTSKSPTCMYLAYKGYKAANIPFVYNCSLPDILFNAKKPLIIGLVINPDRLIEIRKNRLLNINENKETNYVDIEIVREEIKLSKKLFIKNNWPYIDITGKSVEEVSANIIKIYLKKSKF